MWSLVSLAVLAANSSGVDSRIFWATLREVAGQRTASEEDDESREDEGREQNAELQNSEVQNAEVQNIGPQEVSSQHVASQRGMPAVNETFIPLQAQFVVRLGLVIFLIVVVARRTQHTLIEHWPPRATHQYLPRVAASRVHKLAQGRRLFNDYEYSSYLQWRLAGQPRLYIDLLNAYKDKLMFDYFDILQATSRGKTLMHQLKINAVFLRRHKKEDGMAKLAAYLNKQPHWRRVYSGADGTLWLKDSA
jgi:hypothetical protein